MSNVRAALKLAAFTLLNAFAYPISRLVPRSRLIWVFGAVDNEFSGNPKYLFLWISKNRPDIHAVWISGDRRLCDALRRNGYRAHARWSPSGMLAALRAKVYFFGHFSDDVVLPFSAGALLVNLWHGVGLKAVNLGLPQGRTFRMQQAAKTLIGRFRYLKYTIRPDLIVTTSDFMQRHFMAQFLAPAEKCPILGYPRLDCASDPSVESAAADIDADMGFAWSEGRHALRYIYLPTFRDSSRDFLAEAIPDMGRLDRILRQRNAILYIKPHPRTPASADFSKFENVKPWPVGIDFQTYLHQFEGLITDYSSVLYDYLAIGGTNAILYTFDIDEYLSKDRDLIYPFEENTAGIRVQDFDGLCAVLEQDQQRDPTLLADIHHVRARFWDGSPMPASPTVVAFVEAHLA